MQLYAVVFVAGLALARCYVPVLLLAFTAELSVVLTVSGSGERLLGLGSSPSLCACVERL